MSFASFLKFAQEVVTVPEAFHDASTHIYLFTIAMLPVILPLSYIVVARVYDATVTVPLVVFELALVQTIRRDLLADTLTVTILVKLAEYLRHCLALAKVQVEADLLRERLISLVRRVRIVSPIFQVLLDEVEGERPKTLPFLPQIVRYLVA